MRNKLIVLFFILITSCQTFSTYENNIVVITASQNPYFDHAIYLYFFSHNEIPQFIVSGGLASDTAPDFDPPQNFLKVSRGKFGYLAISENLFFPYGLNDFGQLGYEQSVSNSNTLSLQAGYLDGQVLSNRSIDGISDIAAGGNPINVKRGMDVAVEHVVDLISTFAKPIENKEEIKSEIQINFNESLTYLQLLDTIKIHLETGDEAYLSIQKFKKLIKDHLDPSCNDIDLELLNNIKSEYKELIINIAKESKTWISNAILNFNKKNLYFIKTSQLSLNKIINYLKDIKFYFGNDTGFAHLTVSHRIPSLILHGDAPPHDYSKFISPIINKNKIISKNAIMKISCDDAKKNINFL